MEAALAHSAGVLRRRRRQVDTVERRAERAQVLAELGELSSARQALEGAARHVGSSQESGQETSGPETPLPNALINFRPALRQARKGAVGGP